MLSFVGQIESPPEGFKYGTIEGSYMADYFKNSNNTYFRQIWRHMQNNNVKQLVDGVNAVSTGYVKFYAFNIYFIVIINQIFLRRI